MGRQAAGGGWGAGLPRLRRDDLPRRPCCARPAARPAAPAGRHAGGLRGPGVSGASDHRDRDEAMRTLVEELHSKPPAERQRSRWVMDAEMWRYLRSLFAAEVPPFAMEIPRGDGLVMLGLPVELRDGVEGAHLESAS